MITGPLDLTPCFTSSKNQRTLTISHSQNDLPGTKTEVPALAFSSLVFPRSQVPFVGVLSSAPGHKPRTSQEDLSQFRKMVREPIPVAAVKRRGLETLPLRPQIERGGWSVGWRERWRSVSRGGDGVLPGLGCAFWNWCLEVNLCLDVFFFFGGVRCWNRFCSDCICLFVFLVGRVPGTLKCSILAPGEKSSQS